MAAQSDAEVLPQRYTGAYFAFRQVLQDAVKYGDLATLQQAGTAAIVHAKVCPLEPALHSRQPHVVAWLVEESERTGIDIAEGWKLVHAAAYCGNVAGLRAASDEELSLLTDDGETVVHAAAAGDQAEAVEYLVRERGVVAHMDSGLDYTALDMASVYGCLSAIEALVACGARLHDEPGKPSKALMEAARHGQVAAMEKLVELGADIALVDHTGAVHAAARSGSVEAIDGAVRLGADPRAVDREGATALHAAAESNQPGGMRRLVQLGVPINTLDNDGRTALHLAYSSPQACRTLLELGADRWIKDGQGETVRETAVRFSRLSGVHQVLQLLDTYWAIVPCMAQLLLGLRGPSESSLTRFAAHTAFEPKVLSLVNCLLTGKDDKAFAQLVSES